MPEHRSLFSGSTPKDQLSWDWHEILTQGVKTGETDTTPALHLVQNKANWGFDGLNEISRELVWLAVQPTSSATLQLRDIRRVVAFALKFKKVLSATFEQAVGELFSRSLVDTANGIFLHAWFISVSLILI
ncbi:hypothetical protein MPER_07218 [Moniliophthora perniciosa FA553]|nr:hypothetical protein MPER_07218 [Moniliophthora perniciosa FA553]